MQGAVFGGLLDSPPKPTIKPKYQGTNQTFVFTTIYGEPRLFGTTGANRFYYLCLNEFLAFGGGSFAICLEEDLLRGTSEPSEAFGNLCLAHSEDFELKNVEEKCSEEVSAPSPLPIVHLKDEHFCTDWCASGSEAIQASEVEKIDESLQCHEVCFPFTSIGGSSLQVDYPDISDGNKGQLRRDANTSDGFLSLDNIDIGTSSGFHLSVLLIGGSIGTVLESLEVVGDVPDDSLGESFEGNNGYIAPSYEEGTSSGSRLKTRLQEFHRRLLARF